MTLTEGSVRYGIAVESRRVGSIIQVQTEAASRVGADAKEKETEAPEQHVGDSSGAPRLPVTFVAPGHGPLLFCVCGS